MVGYNLKGKIGTLPAGSFFLFHLPNKTTASACRVISRVTCNMIEYISLIKAIWWLTKLLFLASYSSKSCRAVSSGYTTRTSRGRRTLPWRRATEPPTSAQSGDGEPAGAHVIVRRESIGDRNEPWSLSPHTWRRISARGPRCGRVAARGSPTAGTGTRRDRPVSSSLK
jgi:hypothetical protein